MTEITFMEQALPDDAPLQVPLKEAVRLLSYSRSTMYRMEMTGEIAFKRHRGRTYVLMSEIRRHLGSDSNIKRDAVGGPVREPKIRRIKKVILIPHVS